MRMAIAVVCGLMVSPAYAADDDLTVVRRAVQGDEHARPAAAPERRWFRVRIEDRGRTRVKVNLPLPFVRSLAAAADERPGLFCPRGGRCRVKIADVLGALDGGQEFVTLDEPDGHIRIWID